MVTQDRQVPTASHTATRPEKQQKLQPPTTANTKKDPPTTGKTPNKQRGDQQPPRNPK